MHALPIPRSLACSEAPFSKCLLWGNEVCFLLISGNLVSASVLRDCDLLLYFSILHYIMTLWTMTLDNITSSVCRIASSKKNTLSRNNSYCRLTGSFLPQLRFFSPHNRGWFILVVSISGGISYPLVQHIGWIFCYSGLSVFEHFPYNIFGWGSLDL